MVQILVVAISAIAFVALLRLFVFARIRFLRAPYCPVCGESRGRILGVGERTDYPYFRCPHCGHVFVGEASPRRPV